MDEILKSLPKGSWVLDLGSRTGSFNRDRYAVRSVGLDIERPGRPPSGSFVVADAADLPFRGRVFSAVISNHSLEHVQELDQALREIGRVCKPKAAFYAAVPDVTTVTDRLYRWLGRGGGHVNGFRSAAELHERIARATKLPRRAARTLCTSLSFLNPRNRSGNTQLKLWLLARGNEIVLTWANHFLRMLDRYCGTRTSVYGWALYHGEIRGPVNAKTWVNACARCGSAHPSEGLEKQGRVRRKALFWRMFDCPRCGAANFFHRDEDLAHLS